MAGASSSHPPPFDFPPRQIRKILKKAKMKMTMMSEVSRRLPQHFLVLNDKWGEISIKA
jgi:hypothetical protein